MKKEIESFVFYKSFYDAVEGLQTNDEKLKMYNAIFEYCLFEVEPKFDGVLKIIWTLIKPQLDSNIKKRENGKLGGAPRGNKNAKKQPKTTIVDLENNHRLNEKQPNDNVNVNVNDNVNDNVNVNENYSTYMKSLNIDFNQNEEDELDKWLSSRI
jgi:hypothetical protein